MKQEREYGIDALRIAAMWMVVILHILRQGGVLEGLGKGSFRYMAGWFLEAAAYGAVNCYGLISGYVGVKARHRISSVAALWVQVAFYSVGLAVIMHALMPDTVPAAACIRGLFPVSLGLYWYFTAYVFLSFFMPLFNRILVSAPEKELTVCLSAVLVLLSVNTFAFQQDVFRVDGGCSALWLMVLYLTGGMIRLYGDALKAYQWIRRHAAAVFLLATCAAWGMKMLVSDQCIPFIGGKAIPAGALYSYTSPAMILSSVALFSAFAGWRPGKRACRWIGMISPGAFGVYLIHTHPQIYRHGLGYAFTRLAHVKAYLLPFAVLGAAAAIFAACAAIDLLRGKLFRLLKVREKCQWAFERIGLS